MNLSRAAIVCGLVLVLSSILLGQTAAVFDGMVQDVVQKTLFKVGPFRIYPLFKFSTFSWVSNIFGFANNLNRISDLLITPSPEVSAYLLYKRYLILSFTENPEYYFYLFQSGYRGLTNNYRAEARMLLFNRLIVSGRYDNSWQRYLGYQELARVVQGRTDGFTGSLSTETSRGTSLALEARLSRLSYQDVQVSGAQSGGISSRLDRRERTGSVEVGYRLFSATRFVLSGAYSEYDFVLSDSSWRTSRAAEVTAGLQFPGMGRLRGSLMFGFRKFMPKAQGTRGYSGLVANAGLEYRIEDLGVLNLSFSRDNSFSLFQDYLFYIDTSIDGRLTFRTFDFLFIRLGGHYGLLDYPPQNIAGVTNPASGPGVVKDHYSSASGGIIVRFSRSFGIGLTYQVWLRVSRILGGNYNGNLVTIEIIRSF